MVLTKEVAFQLPPFHFYKGLGRNISESIYPCILHLTYFSNEGYLENCNIRFLIELDRKSTERKFFVLIKKYLQHLLSKMSNYFAIPHWNYLRLLLLQINNFVKSSLCHLRDRLRIFLLGRKVMFCSQEIQVFVFLRTHDLPNLFLYFY